VKIDKSSFDPNHGWFEYQFAYSRPLVDFINGFWVNEDYQYTNGSDCKYYILPHMIVSIEKLTEGEMK
jgi:hypothetical protein